MPVDASPVDAAITLPRRRQLASWDAAVVAAATRLGCSERLSEDLSDGALSEGVRIWNPFRRTLAPPVRASTLGKRDDGRGPLHGAALVKPTR